MALDHDGRRGVYIGLGANLGDPVAQLRAALDALDREPGVRVLRVSHAYVTPPWGPVPQPDYVNAVAELACGLDAGVLLDRLLAVERALGRSREGERWGPRTIDLDLLLDGAHVHDLPGCRVPHPRLHQRAFVLVPLAELAAATEVPGQGTVAQCLGQLPHAERDGVRMAEALRPAHVPTHNDLP
jgi:2-amino-4-hydroxy-6-hydroxymethyldihydropteridine diphosphokinase